MLEAVHATLEGTHLALVLFTIVAATFLLVQGADMLVSAATQVARRIGMPPIAIALVIIAPGTSSPIIAFTLIAVARDQSGLALGAVVGSVLLGGVVLPGFASLAMKSRVSLRQFRWSRTTFLASCFGFVILSFAWTHTADAFSSGGQLPQALGFFFLLALALHVWREFRTARSDPIAELLFRLNFTPRPDTQQVGTYSRNESLELEYMGHHFAVLRLLIGVLLVIVSASFLVLTFEIMASRLSVEQGLIGTTLAAFCVSLPEVIVGLVAAWKGQFRISLGNSLNCGTFDLLLVAGLAVTTSPGGFFIGREFFVLIFPALLILLVFSQLALHLSSRYFRWAFGMASVLGYVVFISMVVFL